MHVCMYACMHACMHVCMYACMHACMRVCTDALHKIKHAVYSSELGRREVGVSLMALLFPIPGVRGRIFAADEKSAWDDDVLRTLQPALIINLTRKPCPGCTLTSLSLS